MKLYEINDELGIFDPVLAANSFGMSARFKGGGDPPSSQMADTEAKKYSRETLYPMVQRGMEGKGYGTSQLTNMRENSLYAGAKESFETGKRDFNSQMARTLDPNDTRVKDHLSSTLEREYVTKQDNIARGIRSEKVADINTSMNLANDYLSSEKRMGVNNAQSYNNAMQADVQRNSQMGSFGVNVASGLGQAVGGLQQAQQIDAKYAQKMGTA